MNNNILAKPFSRTSLLKFALPNVVMMVFLSLYTIVDGIFISRFVGELALSATNMFYPVTSIQLAISIMLGTGGSALIVIKMGQGDAPTARGQFTFVTVVSLFIGIFTALLCFSNLEHILTLLGTSSAQMDYAQSYGRYMLYFSPMLFLQGIFQIFFVSAGKPKLGLAVMVTAGVTNMILDYLFMGPLQMGVIGAALATGIGYSIPAVVGLIYFSCNRKGSLYFAKFNFEPKFLMSCCFNGSSEMVSNVATAISTFLFNIIFMRFWAENGVAAITILGYFQFVFSSMFMGFSMGVAPVISYKYGANDKQQLKKACRFSAVVILGCSVAMFLISRQVIGPVLFVFTDRSSPVYHLAISGFGIYSLQFLFMGFSIFASSMFTALGNGVVSALISIFRTFLFLVLCLLLFPVLWGETGVWWAVPAAELMGLLISIFFFIWGRKKYGYQ